MSGLVKAVLISSILAASVLSCNHLDKTLTMTYDAEILKKGSSIIWGKKTEGYFIKEKRTGEAFLIENSNYPFYKENAKEIDKQIEIGKNYEIVVNRFIFNFNPNIVSVKEKSK